MTIIARLSLRITAPRCTRKRTSSIERASFFERLLGRRIGIHLNCWPISTLFSARPDRVSIYRLSNHSAAVTVFAPALLNSSNTLGVSFGRTARIRSVSTVTSNPCCRPSSAVARTQYSVAIPLTPTRSTFNSLRRFSNPVNSNPEYPAPSWVNAFVDDDFVPLCLKGRHEFRTGTARRTMYRPRPALRLEGDCDPPDANLSYRQLPLSLVAPLQCISAAVLTATVYPQQPALHLRRSLAAHRLRSAPLFAISAFLPVSFAFRACA